MTLRHMKIFLEVYREENITRAARNLNLTQPAVTRAIQELESCYGVRLFERINRRLKVTESGRMLHSYALHIVDTFEQMERGLRNWDELGVLRVGTSITLGNSLLPGVLKRFREAYPDLKIRSTVSNGASLRQALLEDQLDFAVIEGGETEEPLQTRAIAPDRLVLIMPPEDPRQHRKKLLLRDIQKDNLLLREEGSVGRSLVDQVFALHSMPVVPTMESASTQAIIRGVNQGLGISFLPEQMVRGALAAGLVSTREIDDASFRRNNYLVWHRQKFLTDSARAMMECFYTMSFEEKSGQDLAVTGMK